MNEKKTKQRAARHPRPSPTQKKNLDKATRSRLFVFGGKKSEEKKKKKKNSCKREKRIVGPFQEHGKRETHKSRSFKDR